MDARARKVERPRAHHGHRALQAPSPLGSAVSAVGSDEDSGPRNGKGARVLGAREGAQLVAPTLHDQRRKLRRLAQGMMFNADDQCCVLLRGLTRHDSPMCQC